MKFCDNCGHIKSFHDLRNKVCKWRKCPCTKYVYSLEVRAGDML